MAVDTVLLTRYHQVAAKVETTTGTAIALGAADATSLLMNGKVTPNINFIQRNKPASLGVLKGRAGARGGNLTFQQQLYGKGTSGLPTWASLFLPACGLAATGAAFAPDPTADTTLTMALFRGGRKKLLTGCCVTMKVSISHDQPVLLDWSFLGVYVNNTDEAMLSPTYDDVVPLVGTNTLTFGGATYIIGSVDIDLGNTIAMRQDVNAKDASDYHLGYRSAWITGQIPTIRITPESALVATKDWYTDLLAANEITLNCIIGSVAGNKSTITGTLQATSPPTEEDRDGIEVEAVDLQFVEDSFSWTFQ